MTVYDDLRARGNLAGFYTRPTGSTSIGPKAGTRVNWVLCQPIQDLLEQGKRLGWANLGTIGNKAHLQKHGDHTGHSYGKTPGIVYAKDTSLPTGGTAALLKLCRLPDYDTSWIDFFNVDGSQYSYAGVRRGPSGDHHLHISVRRGAELKRVGLFDDIAAVLNGTFGQRTVPPAFGRLGFIDGATLVKLSDRREVWLAGRGKRTWIKDEQELGVVRDYLEYRGMQSGIITVTTLSGTVV